MPAPRSAWVACALALVLATAGVAAAATPKLASIHRLSAAQFAAIERVYVAALPLDTLSDGGPPSQAQADRVTRKAVSACLKLSTKDPLLRALRAGCPAISALTQVTVDLGECSSAACLRSALGRARSALRKAVSGSRTSDRAVNATRLPAACKRPLVTPAKGYAVYRELDGALAKLQHALSTGSASDLAAAQAALDAADRHSSSLPTAKTSLRQLRASCR